METIERTDAPTATQAIPRLCREFLELTSGPAARVAWQSQRAECRTILRQSRQPGYFASEDACWDEDYLVDLLAEIPSDPADVEGE